jgi:hypothetical protein
MGIYLLQLYKSSIKGGSQDVINNTQHNICHIYNTHFKKTQ